MSPSRGWGGGPGAPGPRGPSAPLPCPAGCTLGAMASVGLASQGKSQTRTPSTCSGGTSAPWHAVGRGRPQMPLPPLCWGPWGWGAAGLNDPCEELQCGGTHGRSRIRQHPALPRAFLSRAGWPGPCPLLAGPPWYRAAPPAPQRPLPWPVERQVGHREPEVLRATETTLGAESEVSVHPRPPIPTSAKRPGPCGKTPGLPHRAVVPHHARPTQGRLSARRGASWGGRLSLGRTAAGHLSLSEPLTGCPATPGGRETGRGGDAPRLFKNKVQLLTRPVQRASLGFPTEPRSRYP